MIFLSLRLESYDHIIITILYGNETLIVKEVTSTLLSNEIQKKQNQVEQKGSSLVVMGRKEREGKRSQGSSKVFHFCEQKSHRKDCKHRQEWLKKVQTAEAYVAMSSVDTEVLMTSYVDNTSQDKGWIFNSGSMVHVYSHKDMFNFLVTKRK